jgi:hypothetical protein
MVREQASRPIAVLEGEHGTVPVPPNHDLDGWLRRPTGGTLPAVGHEWLFLPTQTLLLVMLHT